DARTRYILPDLTCAGRHAKLTNAHRSAAWQLSDTTQPLREETMSRISCLLIALAIVFFLAEGTASAQEHAGHHDQAVAGGGIAAEGWMGMVDRGSNADVNASHLAEGSASAQEHAGHHDQAVVGVGIAAEGWMGMVDRGSNADVNAALLAEDGDALHIMTGPSVAYWRPENTGSGTYRVSATFTEP